MQMNTQLYWRIDGLLLQPPKSQTFGTNITIEILSLLNVTDYSCHMKNCFRKKISLPTCSYFDTSYIDFPAEYLDHAQHDTIIHSNNIASATWKILLVHNNQHYLYRVTVLSSLIKQSL